MAATIFMSRPPFASRNPRPKERRTATSVCAGKHDPLPHRDILTTVLTTVKSYKIAEKDDEAKRARRRAKKLMNREKKRLKGNAKASDRPLGDSGVTATPIPTQLSMTHLHVNSTTAAGSASAFWRARPTIHIPAALRSMSVTPPPMATSPPPMPSSTASTPGPSSSSSTSGSSSKRPRTPDDDEDFDSLETPRERKKRVAVRKGWKGWVEGSPPPSEKLINLDAVPILQERRTRSGKSFDAIGVGKEGWV